ncbi:Na+/H+ antiporter subunit A [Georgenia sp. Z1491]|uniref:Na+/H+ antiporter subunit A n=1 Tax=Georgenia sp. Z1491 TaxID=3416707 RepID=UPI003CE71C18
MIELLTLHAVVAVAAPPLVSRFGRRIFLLLALAPASAAVWALWHTREVFDGDAPTQFVSWVPGFDLHLDFRLDALAWLMTIVVGGVGALVLAFCAAYFSKTAAGLPRFAGVFVAFAGAMLGLVTTDSTLLLYVFWELTTVFSFLLIGHSFDRQSARRSAVQAILVTTLGGLAMLAGFIALGEMDGGSYRLSGLVESGAAGRLAEGPLLTSAIVLVLVGALSKSALVPFHFWLPAAMAAPTPVSAYLHAAAMVKAGVYLVARLAPGLAWETSWQIMVLGFGLGTLLIGGYRALRQHDLKLVLAFGTVSQLGFLIALVGHGQRAVALAGLTLLLAHALFKSCLFLSVGIIDWTVGSRDLRTLSGLGRQMPVLAVVMAIATASMAGLPPTLGYLGKEAALEALVHGSGWVDVVTLVGVVVGSVLTLAYGLRLWWGAFGTKKGVERTEVPHRSMLIMAPPIVLAAASLVAGLVPARLERFLAPHADLHPGEPGHLVLWAGVTPAFLLTVAVVVAGIALFTLRRQVERAQDLLPNHAGAEGVYRRSLVALDHFAADVTALTQRGSLPAYLSTIFVVVAAGALSALVLVPGGAPADVRVADSALQAAVALLVCVSAVLAARARRRLKAVLLLGVAGYGVALLFVLHGAPDLALTQTVVETVTLVVLILVLRRLPAYFSNRPLAASRWTRLAIGTAVGATVAVGALFMTGGRIHPPVTVDFPTEVYEYGYGRNIVNVTLVDARAWDTYGEVSVIVAAATGIASLLFVRGRFGRVERRIEPKKGSPGVWAEFPDPAAAVRKDRQRKRLASNASLRDPQRGQRWLAASATLAPVRRSVMFEIGARLIFHTLIIYSLFLLFSGHNAPGGGFAGGIAAGIALIVRYLAGGRFELAEAMPLHPGHLLGAGLVTMTLAATAPMLFGGTALQSAVFDFTLWPFGDVHLVTTLIFDVGVYLVVIGLVLDILRSLGAEVDRHGELEGAQAPDLSHDDPARASDDRVVGVDRRDDVADHLQGAAAPTRRTGPDGAPGRGSP